jgi:hypothetical protein
MEARVDELVGRMRASLGVSWWSVRMRDDARLGVVEETFVSTDRSVQSHAYPFVIDAYAFPTRIVRGSARVGAPSRG